MQVKSELTFDSPDRKRIYEFVERNGVVDVDAVASALDLESDDARHHLSILKRDGYLEERDGTLRIHIDAGTEEEFDTDEGSFTIRPAREEDLPGVVGAIRQIVEEKTLVEAETVAEQLDYEDALLRRNDHEARMFFVATVDDAVVGWTHLQAPEVEKLGHAATCTLGLLPEYRDRGIGSHLLHRSLEWAASNGYETVYQNLPATNQQAIAFLEAHGGSVEARFSDWYRIDGATVDKVVVAIAL